MKKQIILGLLLATVVLLVSGFAMSFSNASGSDVRGMIAVGERYLSEERYEEAVEILTNAIKVEPKNVQAYVERGAAYIALEQKDEAIEDYIRAIELDPDQSDTLQPEIDILRQSANTDNGDDGTGNKKALTNAELKNMYTLLSAETGSDNSCFLTCLYDKPSQIDPDQVFYSVNSILRDLTDEDKTELLNTLGFSQGVLSIHVSCFSKTDASAFLKQKTGLTLDQLDKQLTYSYSMKLDRYYNPHSDTNVLPITVKYGTVSDSGIYTVGYTGGLSAGYGWTGSKTLEVSFRLKDSEPVFISNKQVEEAKSTDSAIDYRGVYAPILKSVQSKYEYGSDLFYYIYDMDKDGVKELFVLTGTCDANYMYQVYTIADGASKQLGSVSGFESLIGADSAGNLYLCFGYMGDEAVEQIIYNGSSITTKQIFHTYINDGSDYDYSAYCTELPSALVTDYSLLK